MRTRWTAAAYGAVVYLLFLGTFLYAIGFVEGLVVPKGIDDGAATTPGVAVAIDLALLLAFAVPHSVMARPAFKRWWTRVVPRPVERSTYVLVSTGLLALLMWQWRPVTDVVWQVEPTAGRVALYAISFGGWGLLLASTFAIDHLHLFGLQQVGRHARGLEPRDPAFHTPLLYRLVRHPLMLGFLVAFWAAPTMTLGRLVFCVATTGYILVALQLEERDLEAAFGDRYRRYRSEVPMLVPGTRSGRAAGDRRVEQA